MDRPDPDKITKAEGAIVEERHRSMPHILQEIGGVEYRLKHTNLFTVMSATPEDGEEDVCVIVMGRDDEDGHHGFYLEISAADARAFGARFVALANEIERNNSTVQ